MKRTRRLHGQWPRDVASAACVTRMRGCCGCSSCVQRAWWHCEPGLESTTRQTWEQRRSNTPLATSGLELMDGGDHGPRAVAEAAKDCRVLIWNVRNEHETSGWFWICVGMVIAILMVLSGGVSAKPISDHWRRQKVTRMLHGDVQ